MQNSMTFTGAVVGSGSLAIRFAEILLKHQWSLAIVTDDPAVIRWSESKEITSIFCSDSSIDIDNLESFKFDYLFAVGESKWLLNSCLEFAQKASFHCHDSYLPAYAGHHAAAWAIISQEDDHGTSWHDISGSDIPGSNRTESEVSEAFYGGEIVSQAPIKITPEETSLTLNVKCYEAAIASFESLVNKLIYGDAASTPSFSKHCTFPASALSTYHAATDRPNGYGILNFRHTAAELSALVRGLNFGSGYVNPLGTAKLWLGGSDYVAVDELKVLDQSSAAPPGSILGWQGQTLFVATQTSDVALTGFISMTGQTVSPQGLWKTYGFSTGHQLPLLSEAESLALQQQSEAIASEEEFWSKRLETRQALRLPALAPDVTTSSTAPGAAKPTIETAPFNLPHQIQQVIVTHARQHLATTQHLKPKNLHQPTLQSKIQQWLTAAFAAFLSRLNPESQGHLDFQPHSPIQPWEIELGCHAAQLNQALFAKHLPLRIQCDLEQTFEYNLATLNLELEEIQFHQTYAQDLWLRHPVLKEQLAQTTVALPLAVQWNKHIIIDNIDCSAEATEIWPDGRLLLLDIMTTPDKAATRAQEQGQIQEALWKMEWHYDRTQLSPAALRHLQEQFLTFLTGLVQHPHLPLCQQPILTEAERQQVLHEWNQTERTYPLNCCVHELFEQQAEQTPNQIALCYQQQKLTYEALNQRANQLAHYLHQQGLKPEECVGVHLDRSLDMIVALLGVLKAGAAYVPMDPTYPQERLAWMREDAAPKLVLTQAHLLEKVPGGLEGVVCLDSDWAKAIAPHPTHNPEPTATPQNLAYIIYTSGSTGRPKGVMIEHRSLTNLSQAVIHDYKIACDIVLEFASISFDMAVEEIYPCLISGGMLVIRTAEMIQSIPDFLDQCETLGITVLSLPTAYWHLLVAELNADPSLRIPEKVRVVLIGGEAANPKRVVQWQQICHRTGCNAQLLNTYGPTEATVDSTAYHFELPPVEALDPAHPPAVPIGYPISNVTNYVLDRYQQPVPVGALGELCVGGAGVARGYLNRPDLTEERFVPDPFSASSEARLYRTGDLVRHREDGAIEYMGRIDNQVKIRGFRIELGEIEAVLSQQAAVEEAVVIVREDQPGQKHLVAYIVPQSGATVMGGELQTALQQKLPEYMVPKAFVELAMLPMTPNEKVDRKALPKPDLSALATNRQGHIPPQTPVEKQLAEIWENILGISHVGATDSFLELGGDSLTAMRLFMQIERVFDRKLSLSTLFQFPTVEALAQVIAGEADNIPKTSIVPLQSQGSKPPLFFVNCSQEGNRVASYVGEDYPFYGLNIFGTTERLFSQLDQLTLTNIAQEFIKDIQQIQPQGPYYLASYCGDTRLALELAHEFRRQGETVALLALLDPWWNDAPPTVQYHLQNLRYFGVNYVVEKAREKVSLLRSDLLLEFEKIRTQFRRRFSDQAPSAKDQDIALYSAFWQASHLYQPTSYDGNVIVLLSEELRIDTTGELDEVWQAFPTDYPVFSVPGYHHEIFEEPGIQVIGDRLRESIDAAIAAQESLKI